MTDSTQPMIDMGAEAATGPLEFAIVAIIAGFAFAYLLRGFLRRRSKAGSGEGCTGCPGCSSTGSCPPTTQFTFEPGKE
ncbi:FeoB-associated Cys-rich membrane protein [Tropicimonas marinistellae]|uniref:FeoB-associated Cys-rich membrane protein n=1 Tax=Tropicimonas marinistellae TaxID=1739787 RepID=UPI000830A1A8|nr:FeoB-associated Cys-rich membrane protein [Tropicimonas marinistellae]